jgi:hypothetical protein
MIDRIFEFGLYWDWYSFILYFFIGCTVTWFLYLDKKKSVLTNRKQLTIYGFFAFFVMFVFFAFRSSSVGTDTNTYVEWFLNAQRYSFSYQDFIYLGNSEPLFQLYQVIVRSLSSNYTFYFIISSIIINLSYVFFIRNFTSKKNVFVVFILIAFMFYYDMSALRSALGMSFVFYGLISLKNNKIVKSIFLFYIGSMFHYTLLIMLFFILFYLVMRLLRRVKIKNSVIFFMIVLFVVFLLSQVGLLRSFLQETQYAAYASLSQTLLGYWFIYLLIVFFIIYWKKYIHNYTRDKEVIFFLILFQFVIMPVIIFLGAYRFINYLMLPRLVFWSYLLYYLRFDIHKYFKNRLLINIVYFIFVTLYLLFRLSRVTDSPGFIFEFFS